MLKIFNTLLFSAIFLNYAIHAAPDSIAERTASDFTAVAKKTIPAVVSIQVKSSNKGVFGGEDESDGFNEDFFRFFFGPGRERGRTQPTVGQASGFIIKPNGYVLTNSHVVKDASEIKVILNDGREFQGKVVGQDPNTDIALVKIDADGLDYLNFGNSDNLEIGQWVIAIGNPFGLQASLTVGVVSAKGRNNLDLTTIEDFVQTDAAINRGHSGGPLLNLASQVVGMNTAIATNNGSGGSIGIGFAIPSNLIQLIVNQLIQKGTVSRGFIGVTLQQIDQELAHAFGLSQVGGAVIADVAKDSPAEKAGLKQGDIVQKYNKLPVTNIASLRNFIALMTPGTQINLSILRNGTPKDIVVEIGNYPTSSPQVALRKGNKLGFEVQDLTPDIVRKLGLDDEIGVVITDIEQGSTAAWAGLKKGSVILAVNQKDVHSVKEFNEFLEQTPPNRPVLFLIKQGEGVRFVSIKVE